MIQTILIWLKAIRLQTLPLALASIILGSALAAYDGYFNSHVCIIALLTACLLQVISNLANDYGDTVSGADDEQRVGPKRVMQSGLVSLSSMRRALLITTIAALASGIYLVSIAFHDSLNLAVGFFLMGVVAIIAAITYTVGKTPYGYKGYGDISVFVFFGLVGVLGSYSLYSREISLLLLLPAIASGLLAACVLNINNIRDLENDKRAGKLTLATRLGYNNAIAYHWIMLICAELAIMSFIILGDLPTMTWLHLLAIPVLIFSARQLGHYRNGQLMNAQLKNTVVASFSYCSLLALGLVI